MNGLKHLMAGGTLEPIFYYSAAESGAISANGIWPDQMENYDCQLAGGASISLTTGFGTVNMGSGYYGVPDEGVIPLIKDFTICMWAKDGADPRWWRRWGGEGYALNTDGGRVAWGRSGSSSGAQYGGWFLDFATSSDGGITRTGYRCIDPDRPYDLGNPWQHVTFVREGTNAYTYVDAELKKTISCNDDPLPPQQNSFWIGGIENLTDKNAWQEGYSDEIRLYTKPLTQPQIQEVMNINARK